MSTLPYLHKNKVYYDYSDLECKLEENNLVIVKQDKGAKYIKVHTEEKYTIDFVKGIVTGILHMNESIDFENVSPTFNVVDLGMNNFKIYFNHYIGYNIDTDENSEETISLEIQIFSHKLTKVTDIIASIIHNISQIDFDFEYSPKQIKKEHHADL